MVHRGDEFLEFHHRRNYETFVCVRKVTKTQSKTQSSHTRLSPGSSGDVTYHSHRLDGEIREQVIHRHHKRHKQALLMRNVTFCTGWNLMASPVLEVILGKFMRREKKCHWPSHVLGLSPLGPLWLQKTMKKLWECDEGKSQQAAGAVTRTGWTSLCWSVARKTKKWTAMEGCWGEREDGKES